MSSTAKLADYLLRREDTSYAQKCHAKNYSALFRHIITLMKHAGHFLYCASIYCQERLSAQSEGVIELHETCGNERTHHSRLLQALRSSNGLRG